MAKTKNFVLKMFRDWISMFEGFGILKKFIISSIVFIILFKKFYYIIKYCVITLFIIFINFFKNKIVSLFITDIIAVMTSLAISIGILILIRPKNWLKLFNKIKGIGIFIEAGILLVLNFSLLYLYKEYYVSKKEYIISFISSNSSATAIFAILTSLVLSAGFIYWLGHFIAVRLWNFEAQFGSSGPLREHIIPFGALFFIVFFLPLLMMFLSEPIRFHITLNIVFVLICGFVNEYIMRYLRPKPMMVPWYTLTQRR